MKLQTGGGIAWKEKEVCIITEKGRSRNMREVWAGLKQGDAGGGIRKR